VGPDWPDRDRVFTREDGTPVPEQWTSTRFEILAYRSGQPPIRFHDLRHGTASLLKAAGVDTKIISAILGHSRTSFTDSVYVNSRELHQPGEKPQFSRSQDRRNSVPLILMPAL
jgi:integrase